MRWALTPYYALRIMPLMIRLADLVERLGGVPVVRDVTGEKYQTVTSWVKRNGYIPQHHHPALEAYAQKRGIDVTIELLVQAAVNERAIKAELAKSKEDEAA